MEAVAAAERARGFAELRVDERVDDHRRPALRAVQREVKVVDRLDPRVADLLELLVRELGLERVDEPDGRLAGGVGDHVELDLLRRHERQRHARRDVGPRRAVRPRRAMRPEVHALVTVPRQTCALLTGRLDRHGRGAGRDPKYPARES